MVKLRRETKETQIEVELDLEGGDYQISVPCGFFQHMLESFSKHSGLSLKVEATGDIHVDYHHTVEDTGIVIGEALFQALGDKKGIARFGDATIPMDEALVAAAVDISGRGGFYMHGSIPGERVGDMPVELVEEFFNAFCRTSGITLHVRVLAGRNAHHTAEALFKAVAVALKRALKKEGGDIPSTKGVL